MFYKYSCIRVSLLLVTLVFMHTSSASSVHSSQLNTGDIERFEIDPSNQYVVYNEFDLKGELNRFSSLLIEKSNAVKIANSINTRNENRFWIEPENLKVLHQAASETTIISTAIEGDNSPTILSSFSPSEPSGELQSINKLVVSDDSNLVYFSTLEGGLYKTPSNGETPATDLVSRMTVDRFSLSPNQEFIVFSTNSDHRQIFFVPTLGDTPPVFLANLPEAIAINNLSISPDNEKILFTVEFLDRNPTQIQLFSIALNAQPALRALSDPLIGNDIAMRFKITKDSNSVIYSTLDRDQEVGQLFSSTINQASSPVLLDTAFEIHDFKFNTTKLQVVYSRTIAKNEIRFFNGNEFTLADIVDIASIDISGGADPFTVSMPFEQTINSGDETLFIKSFNFNSVNTNVEFALSDDGEFVYYVADTSNIFSNASATNLYQVSSNELCIRKQLNSTLSNQNETTSVTDFTLIEDGNRVLYTANENTPTVNQLFSVTTASTSCTTADTLPSRNKLSLSAIELGNVTQFDVSSDERYVVFSAFNESQGQHNLHSIQLEEQSANVAETCFPIKNKTGKINMICF